MKEFDKRFKEINNYQKKLLTAAKEIQSAVNFSRELYYVMFGITISTKFADDKVEITAKWWLPDEQKTSVIISAEMLADYDKPVWGETIRSAFNLLDKQMKQVRFTEFQLKKVKKIYGP